MQFVLPFPSHQLVLPSGAPFQFREGRACKGTKEIFPQRGSEPLASLKRHFLTRIHSPPLSGACCFAAGDW